MEKWYEIRKGGHFGAIARALGIDPVTARVMVNRGISSMEEARRYLYGGLDDLENPDGLTGLEEAAALLEEKIKADKPIRVIGDYDIDGVCATTILMRGLSALGGKVSYDIPERLTDGYGLNIRLVEEAAEDGIDTLVTVDNGISAADQIQRAKDLGMTVIVTDHHEPPYEDAPSEEVLSEDLPSEALRSEAPNRPAAGKDRGKPVSGRVYRIPHADVVVDPSLPDCPYANKALCGAGVAWKLLYVLERRLLKAPAMEDCPLTMHLLPFAAFATVGDVMDLTGENRVLVKQGLRALPLVRNCGMQALIDACGLRGRVLSAYHIGFVLGPCINAGGRLATAHQAARLFLTADPAEAHQLAGCLCDLNQERRGLTDQGVQRALAMLKEEEYASDRVLVLYLPGTHESIVGIIAGKVREATGKPSFVLTDAREEGQLKGSGRSIEPYSMFDEMVKCSDLLDKFGGHPMAAGLSLKRENLAAFRSRLNKVCTLTKEDLAFKVELDARLPLSSVTEDLIKNLSLLEPFGKGNARPLFGETDLSLKSCRILGAAGRVVKLVVSKGGRQMSAVHFGDGKAFLQKLRDRWGEDQVAALMAGRENRITIMASFYPEVNEYRERRELQIVITNFR